MRPRAEGVPRVLFAGETDPAGPARYVLGALRAARVRAVHVPCTQRLTPADVRAPDALILSDYPRRLASPTVQRMIASRVDRGMGLLMIGGWSSFAAPFGGGWHGSIVERLLPVRCAPRDDRRNLAAGAVIRTVRPHPILRGLPLQRPPVLCGFNDVRVPASGQVVLEAVPLVTARGTVRLSRRSHPLLVVDRNLDRRVAALTTDVAPHWCGGLVDWGDRRVTVSVTRSVQITVGDAYLRFLGQLIRWLVCR